MSLNISTYLFASSSVYLPASSTASAMMYPLSFTHLTHISDIFILCSKFEDLKQLITNQKKLICVINNTFSEENEYLCFKKNNNPINNKYVCELCGNNFYIRYDNNNNYRYIYCYENPEGYYLDINDFHYKLCYFSCKFVK